MVRCFEPPKVTRTKMVFIFAHVASKRAMLDNANADLKRYSALTPGVVVQATSTNDEILAAFPLLIAVQFAIRFHRGGAVADLCLALIAAALSIGTKLHAVFYWPVVVAAGETAALLALGAWIFMRAAPRLAKEV